MGNHAWGAVVLWFIIHLIDTVEYFLSDYQRNMFPLEANKIYTYNFPKTQVPYLYGSWPLAAISRKIASSDSELFDW